MFFTNPRFSRPSHPLFSEPDWARRQRLDQKLRRRVHADMSHIPRFTMIQYGSYFISIGIGAYMVLYHDYGYKEHCFTPVREWFFDQVNNFWTLSDEEAKELGLDHKK